MSIQGKIGKALINFIKMWGKWFFLLFFLTLTEFVTNEIIIPVFKSAKDISGASLVVSLIFILALPLTLLTVFWPQLKKILNAIYGESEAN